MLTTVLSIAGFPYKKILANAIVSIREIKSGALNRKEKIMTIMSLLPLAAAIVTLLTALIVFIGSGGFATEIDLIKDEGISALNNIWTNGTIGYFFNPCVSIPVTVINLVIKVFAVMDMFQNGKNWKKVVFIITSVISFVSALISTIAVIDLSFVKAILSACGINAGDTAVLICIGIAGIGAIGFLISAILLFGYKPYLRSTLNLLAFFTLIPFTGLVIENIIGLILLVVFAIVFFAVGNTCIPAMLDATDSSGSETSSGMDSRERKKLLNRRSQLENKMKSSQNNINGKLEGRFGYGTTDLKYHSNVVNNCRSEIDQINEELMRSGG